jgi:hypothetical protein
MITEFQRAILKTPDGIVVAEGLDGYHSTDRAGWFLLTGVPEDFPTLSPGRKYILDANGTEMTIFTREVNHTLMVTTHHVSVEFTRARSRRVTYSTNDILDNS